MDGYTQITGIVMVLAGLVTSPGVTTDRETCVEQTGDVAIAACTRLITSGDFSGNSLAVIYYNRGLTWYDKSEFDRAIQDYDRAVQLEQNFAQAIFSRGNAYDAEGQYDRAIENYDRAISLNPHYAMAFNNRGYVWDEKHSYDRAIEDYDRAIDLNPKYAQAFNNRGVAYLKKGDCNRAIKDFDRAIELGYAEATYNRMLATPN
jgi:tetratricopeptide (TPR) repeat protein